MSQLVTAVEFRGDDLPLGIGATRVAVCAHAYDVAGGVLAHPDEACPRVGFPRPVTGWNAPSALPRCPGCRDAVSQLVATVIHGVMSDCLVPGSTRAELARADDSAPARDCTGAHRPTASADGPFRRKGN